MYLVVDMLDDPGCIDNFYGYIDNFQSCSMSTVSGSSIPLNNMPQIPYFALLVGRSLCWALREFRIHGPHSHRLICRARCDLPTVRRERYGRDPARVAG
jgi:hypothetical protein